MRTVLRSRQETDSVPLGQSARNVVPSFVHVERGQTGLKCLAKCDSVPPGTLDFHVFDITDAQKISLFEQQLKASGSVHVLARVEGLEDDRAATIDLGLEVPGVLSRKACILRTERMKPNDCVVVELQPHTITRIEIRYLSNLPVTAVCDLKSVPQPLAWLDAHSKSGRRPIVRGKLAKVHPLPEKPDDSICFLDLGFKVFVKGQALDPRFTCRAAAISEVGETVTIEINAVEFTQTVGPLNACCLSITARERFKGSFERALSGALLSERQPNGRRRWWGIVGDLKKQIPRGELTCDLRKLLMLDEMDDEVGALRSLCDADRPVQLVDKSG